MEVFELQDLIDIHFNLAYRISSFLFRFMIRADADFIPIFLTRIEKYCIFNGKMHKTSIRANLKYLEPPVFDDIIFKYGEVFFE